MRATNPNDVEGSASEATPGLRNMVRRRLPGQRTLLQSVAVADCLAIVVSMCYLAFGSSTGAWNVAGAFVVTAVLGTIIAFLSSETKRSVATFMGLGVAGGMLVVQQLSIRVNPQVYPVVQLVVIFGILTVGSILLWSPRPESAGSAGRLRLWLVVLGYATLVAAVGMAYFRTGLPRPTSELFQLLYIQNWLITPTPVTVGLATIALAVVVFRWTRRSLLKAVSLFLGAIVLLVSALPIGAALMSGDKLLAALANAGVSEDTQPGFLASPYSLAENILPSQPDRVRTDRDVVFYQGEDDEFYPQDAGLMLSADVHQPVDPRPDLPGTGSILVRVHGGGWTGGDKGEGNFPAQNAYFAAQGYTVFDIQYGLSRVDNGRTMNPYGDYSVDDMVRHVGIFSTWLADHAADYEVGTESVFYTGGSAGGQLALAAALVADHPVYKDWFDSRITVRGVIALYPASTIAPTVGIAGSTALTDVRNLISPNSPPALILTGSNDFFVPPTISQDIVAAYQAHDVDAGLFIWPWGDHIADANAENPFSQTYLYAAERFMHHYRNTD